SRALRHAHLLAVLLELETDARRLAVLRVGDRQVRQMDGGFLGDDAAFLRSALLLVAADEVHTADKGAIFLRHDLEDLAGAPLVLAGKHDDLVASFDLLHLSGLLQSTSGASEMIFMWFF